MESPAAGPPWAGRFNRAFLQIADVAEPVHGRLTTIRRHPGHGESTGLASRTGRLFRRSGLQGMPAEGHFPLSTGVARHGLNTLDQGISVESDSLRFSGLTPGWRRFARPHSDGGFFALQTGKWHLRSEPPTHGVQGTNRAD